MIAYQKSSILIIIDYTKIPSKSFFYKLYVFVNFILDYIFSFFTKSEIKTYTYVYKDDFGMPFFEVTVAEYLAKPTPIERFLELLIEKRFNEKGYFYVYSISKEEDIKITFNFIKNAKSEINSYFRYLLFTDTNYQLLSSENIVEIFKNIIEDIKKVVKISEIYLDIEEKNNIILFGISYIIREDKNKKKTFLFKIKPI